MRRFCICTQVRARVLLAGDFLGMGRARGECVRLSLSFRMKGLESMFEKPFEKFVRSIRKKRGRREKSVCDTFSMRDIHVFI